MEHPLPTPFGAFGASILAPTALASTRTFGAYGASAPGASIRPPQPHLMDPPLPHGPILGTVEVVVT